MRIALGIAGLAVSAGAAFGMGTSHAEPDINCVSGDFTGRDTSSPGFIRTYPQACVTKFLGLAHAESFAAPGGDTELVTLGEMGCHALDVDQLNGDVSGARAINAAEPKLTFAFTDGSKQMRDPGRELVSLAIKGLCP
jgi:hypothetical protein